jgi:polyisoprenoid-binding protein YceI
MKAPPAVLLLAAALPVGAAEKVYTVDEAESRLTIDVDKAGLFSFAGHRHRVEATGMTGRIVADPSDVTRSSVSLRFPASGLRLVGKDEPPQDVPKVQAKLEGPEVLDVARFAEILFRSTAVEGREAGGVWNLRVTGELTLRGVSRPLLLPLRVTLSDDRLEAAGQVVIRQSDFGLQPVSVAGVVKVKNELGLDYKIVGRSGP